MKQLYSILLLFIIVSSINANTLNVPSQHATVQAAINAAVNGDTVLVQPGTYFENINFRGKNIVVTSAFFLSNDYSKIDSTIINGSAPAFADTASCVLIISGEDTSAILQGFTLTGGTGTAWTDEHGAGVYIEGGGILIALSSPTIQHNIIRNNNVNRTGGASTGGGGIRLGDASPRILNNIIINNQSMYGGGGIWVNHDPAVIENNTIAGNSSIGTGSSSAGRGGGIAAVLGGSVSGRNNIVWGNSQALGGPILGTVTMTYSDVEGGHAGLGNINTNPAFADSSYYLLSTSSCVDAGDPNSSFNDPENPYAPGTAKFPAKGGLVGDMGAYGGPLSQQMSAKLETPLFVKITTGALVTNGGASRSVNWVDYNNDGVLDLFVSNGLSTGQDNFLYKGDGPPSFTFTRITGSPITSDHAKSDGSSWADIDNDGDPDAFVVNWYNDNNLFYENNGDATFTQITTGQFVNDGGYSETCSWGDYDNDGFVDLYVSNSGTIGTGPTANFLYHNNGDGTFTKITTGDIVTDLGYSRGINWVDYDNDGDEDMFVTNENAGTNFLYKNMLTETSSPDFVRILTGDIVNDVGESWSGSWGDYDNDGDQDLFVAKNGNQNNCLYENNGDGTFTKITTGIAVNDAGYSASSGWGDYDNDGDLDLFVTNAYAPSAVKNFLYRNLLMESGTPTFQKVTEGQVVNDVGYSYGFSWGDYDNDGDLDIFIAKTLNENENNALYRNESAPENHSLEIILNGTSSNRSGIGAKVWISSVINGNTVRQMREVSGQSGYCGQNLVQHFGLGNSTVADTLVIEWPSGLTESFFNIQADQILSATEQDTAPPTQIFPPDFAINQPATLTLTWSHASGNPLFHLQVATDSAFTTIVYEDSSITDSAKQVPSLAYGTNYYWRVAVKKLNRKSDWSTVHSFFVSLEIFQFTTEAKWALVSVPVSLDTLEKIVLFPSAVSPAYEYTGTAYAQRETLSYGTGYWMKFPSSQEITLHGLSRFLDTIGISEGWNLIGSITTPMSVSSMVTVPSGIITSAVFGYQQGYSFVDSLKPMHGYWVRASENGQLILDNNAVAVPKKSIRKIIEKANVISFEDGEGNKQKLYYLGQNDDSYTDMNFEAPPVIDGIFDVRYTSGKILVHPGQAKNGEFPISISGSMTSVTVRWNSTSYRSQASLRVNDKIIELTGNGEVVLPDARISISLVSSGKDELPKSFKVSQNYPNPFNPNTTIEYSLPDDRVVRIGVYNILGEEITRLVNKHQPAGSYRVQWDAGAYSSGLYFYKVEAVNPLVSSDILSGRGRMVLLK